MPVKTFPSSSSSSGTGTGGGVVAVKALPADDSMFTLTGEQSETEDYYYDLLDGGKCVFAL